MPCFFTIFVILIRLWRIQDPKGMPKQVRHDSICYNDYMKNTEYVTASELGDFVFCKRGWWLRFNGLLRDTPAMAQGTQQHKDLAQTVTSNTSKRKVALSIILVGILLLLLAILFLFLH